MQELRKSYRIKADALAWHVYIQWLASKDLLEVWMDRCIEAEDGGIYFELDVRATGQFTWATTPEGDKFWRQSHNEWERIRGTYRDILWNENYA